MSMLNHSRHTATFAHPFHVTVFANPQLQFAGFYLPNLLPQPAEAIVPHPEFDAGKQRYWNIFSLGLSV